MFRKILKLLGLGLAEKDAETAGEKYYTDYTNFIVVTYNPPI